MPDNRAEEKMMGDVLTREQLERIRDDIPSEFHLGAPYRLARTALAYLDRAEKAEALLQFCEDSESRHKRCIASLEAEREMINAKRFSNHKYQELASRIATLEAELAQQPKYECHVCGDKHYDDYIFEDGPTDGHGPPICSNCLVARLQAGLAERIAELERENQGLHSLRLKTRRALLGTIHSHEDILEVCKARMDRIAQLENELAEYQVNASVQVNDVSHEMYRKGQEAVAEWISELETENERLKLQLKGTDCCQVCWTTSWSPCPPGTKDAIKIGGEWVSCDQCQSNEALRLAREENARLTRERDALIELEKAERNYWRPGSTTGIQGVFDALSKLDTLRAGKENG